MRGWGLLVVVFGIAAGACEGKRAAPPPPGVDLAGRPAPAPRDAAPGALAGALVEAPPVDAAGPCAAGEARACDGDRAVVCAPDGQELSATACKGGCRDGACVNACELEGVELAYLFTRDQRLLRFDPRKLPGDAAFTEVGKLDCEPGARANAMAIDRHGIAWLNYHGGKLYTASIHTARCTRINRMPAGAPDSFGMGFAMARAAGAGSGAEAGEVLYVASSGSPSELGRIDTRAEPARYTRLGALPSPIFPELTGTADGKLFGYFPLPGLGFVHELDPATGALVGAPWRLGGTGYEEVKSWTMVHWGGVFYVFARIGDTPTLHAIHRKDGRYERLRMDLPFVAVGAGVSTCAPLLEQVAP